MENPSLTNIPEEYRFTGRSIKGRISAKSMMRSSFAWISRRRMPIIDPCRKIFSRPVSSGWNPEATSSSAAILPRMVISPLVGVVILASNFRMVLLPEPLCPMIPSVSPRLTPKLTSRKAQNSLPGPKRLRNLLSHPAWWVASSWRIRYVFEMLSKRKSIIVLRNSNYIRHSGVFVLEVGIGKHQQNGGDQKRDPERWEIHGHSLQDHVPEVFDHAHHGIQYIQTSKP